MSLREEIDHILRVYDEQRTWVIGGKDQVDGARKAAVETLMTLIDNCLPAPKPVEEAVISPNTGRPYPSTTGEMLWDEACKEEERHCDQGEREAMDKDEQEALNEERVMTGIELIAEERKSQVVRGFTADHDDQHVGQELLAAAGGIVLRALNEEDESISISVDEFLEEYTSVEDVDWIEYIVKHDRPDKIKGLVIAGALIAAEIDRLQRLNQRREV